MTFPSVNNGRDGDEGVLEDNVFVFPHHVRLN